MDSRAKQRITGAVILVAAFVLLVPELLTGPGGKSGGDDRTTNTADEAGLRSYTIDIDAPTNAAPAQQAPQTAVELPTPAAATPMAVPGEAAVPEPAPRDPEPARPDTAAPVTAPPTGAAPPTTTTTPTTSPPATPASAPTSTAAPRAGSRTAVAPPPAQSSGRFAVQLGSFSSQDNANRLVREMTAKGFAAFVAPITSNGRELYRVRVGPARDRAAAEALAAQLRRIGQTGSIVSIS
jgi:DedD protein